VWKGLKTYSPSYASWTGLRNANGNCSCSIGLNDIGRLDKMDGALLGEEAMEGSGDE